MNPTFPPIKLVASLLLALGFAISSQAADRTVVL